MFLEHFELNEQPFGVTADPRFFFLGPKHRAALNMLVSAAQADKGVLMLTAEPGMGKTCLLFHYLQGLRDDPKTAFLFQTAGESIDLLRYLLADLGLQSSRSDVSEMNDILSRKLSTRTQQGERFILVIDDAHNLHQKGVQSPLSDCVDQPWMKLIQIVIAGRPQLADELAQPCMSAFREGISSCIRLTGFTPEETRAYMDYRLRVSGCDGSRLFTPDAQLLIAIQSRGIPRYINSLCFNSMWISYRIGAKQVDSTMVREAVADLVVDAKNLEETRPFAFHRIFAPLASRSKTETEPKRVPSVWRPLSVVASIFTTLCLVIVSGVHWRTRAYSPPVGGQPTASSSAAPAPHPSFAPAPVTTTNRIETATPPSSAVVPTSAAPVAMGSKDVVAPESEPSATPADQFVTVVIQPHVTIRHLSLRYSGRFDAETTAEIRRLNPFLTDMNHIEVGAKIRFPLDSRRAAAHPSFDIAEADPGIPRQEKP